MLPRSPKLLPRSPKMLSRSPKMLSRSPVMEESAAPQELNMMFNNIENNGAPWQFSAADRLKWKDE